jgi:hypothetical protein
VSPASSDDEGMHPYDAQSTIRRDWKSEAATPSRARPRAILLRAGLPVAGVAALWLLGSGAAAYAALVVVFALLLWALDRLVPATGSARADAERAFESAQRKRRRAARRRFRRASGDTGLQLLPAEIQQGASQRARGIQAIRLARSSAQSSRTARLHSTRRFGRRSGRGDGGS